MWRYTAASVRGRGHAARGQPCQDRHGVVLAGRDERVLLACVADGAGSAKHSDRGAEIACDAALRLASALAARGGPETWEPDDARALVAGVQEALDASAREAGHAVQEYATTLLLAAVGERAGAFLQVGDGAIVIRSEDRAEAVFWPRHGEYLNETLFVTSQDAPQELSFCTRRGRIAMVSLFTDGLESVALDLAARAPFDPFFEPFVRGLRECEDPALLTAPLERFLASERLDERTDDDRTLVMAIPVGE